MHYKKIGQIMWTTMLKQGVKTATFMIKPLTFSPTTLSPPPPPPPSLLRSFLRPTTTMTTNQQPPTNLDEIFKQKRTLRTKVRKALKSMDPSLRSQEDYAIQRLVLEAPWFKCSKRLCAYISCSALREVDTSMLLREILRNSEKDGGDQTAKKLYVPRVEDKNSHMRMLNISSMDDLIANSMNILEPAPVDSLGNSREDVLQASDPVDLLLLPGLAFEKSGKRLGRGGGYYDTFLRKYQELAKEKNWKQPLLVALSYSVQIMDEGEIPVTEHDVLVDALVTPSGMIPITPSALDRMQS
ncbi:5-formyltetrahydrofolate cyclo-ligase, mitochondrial [Mercurialis annua]|uniref:5-formyltetrahydrofolate cyclo-ligase, mitochondrial n=1 Tax=Mercurialis annua TaxID=3986 RepID=UPI0021607AFD|nr:5-formyltetrahydrofolate cyclo-ligase, mitochondrial [Mercurialis annua]